MSNPILQPNQIFKLKNVNYVEKDNSCYVDILLSNGKKYNLKVVEPIAIDTSKTILEGATKETLDKAVDDYINLRYNTKKIYLSDEDYDKIDETIDNLKLSRKDAREKSEELEKNRISEIKEELKIKDKKEYFYSDRVFHANGLFLSENSGLIQIPNDSRFKTRNIHSTQDNYPFVDFTFINKDTKKVLKLKDINTIEEDKIKLISKINYLTNINGYKDIFTINEYLINKLMDEKNSSSNKYELYNLLYINIDETQKDFLKNTKELKENFEEKFKNYSDFLKNNFINPLYEILKPYRQSKEDKIFISEEDGNKLKEIYNLFYDVLILRNIENKLYIENKETIEYFNQYFYNLLPYFVNINLSIYIPKNKFKDYIIFLTKSLNSENSIFTIMKNKEKKDYFEKIDEIDLENITVIFKLTKIFDKGNESLHPIYNYPAIENITTPTPRLMGYSMMDNSLVPNILIPTNSKKGGFVFNPEVLNKFRKNF